jgi:malate/lactate dehydrogenase
MTVWGNHDATMVPDYLNCVVDGRPVAEIIDDPDWLRGDFPEAVRSRGKEVIQLRGKSSAVSAAVGVVSGLRSLVKVTPYDNCFTAGVISDGNPYGVPDGLICGFPCHSNGEGDWEIASGFRLDDHLEAAIAVSVRSLIDERDMVKELLNV